MSVKLFSKEDKTYKMRGGVRLKHNKDTASLPTVDMPAPKRVVLPMRQHIGACLKPIVNVGDRVLVGQKIGDSDEFVCAPIHASISGVVTNISNIIIPSMGETEAVEIESDGKMKYADFSSPSVGNVDELLKAVRESGLVGLGGAGFPTHVKLKPVKGNEAKTLIINCAECEPYITSDFRECVENSWDILSAIYTLKDLLGYKRVYIGVEDNKKEAITILENIADDNRYDKDKEVFIRSLKSIYPMGAEKVLVRSITGKKVLEGGIPLDVGIVVLNITTLSFISRYLKTGRPLISRRVTITGNAVKNPMNVNVPVGTSIQDVLEFAGGLAADTVKIMMGGPMMGLSVHDANTPVLKNNNAIVAFNMQGVRPKTQTQCMRCARCVKSCPMCLMPTEIVRLYERGDYERLKEYSPLTCIECGCCSYVCPAGLPLVQSIRLAKERMIPEK